jgi:hypothetical protein
MFAVGEYRLFDANDMNDMTSSIQVPEGLVAYVYEHADSAGGYGLSADFMENCADLSQYNLNDKISYINVFNAEQPSGLVWARNSIVNGEFVPGHWERKRASGQPINTSTVVVSPPLPPRGRPDPQPGLPNLLDISMINGSPWTNPAFDTSDPNWSSNLVGGQTFDGSSAHKFEWVSVLNPTEEQDDEVGVAGFALAPDYSSKDLPFTHPFGGDFEFTIIPDPAYEGLLATANKDPNGDYKDSWPAAQAEGLQIPSGVLALEVDRALVPPDYQPVQGDRVAVFGRWIVDAGHDDFHAEIHPPLLMARARSVDGNGNPIIRSESAITLFHLWSRPYQAGQLFTTDGHSGLCLRDYAKAIAETLGDVQAFPPVFAKPFQGIHIVSFTIRPPVPPPPPTPVGAVTPTLQLQCSYHFTVNGSCGVEVIRSPSDPNAILVVLALNDVGYPTLPELPSHFDHYSIDSLLAQVPGGANLSWLQDAWLDIKGSVDIRQYSAPQMSQTQDSVNVVSFTPLDQLPSSAQATDSGQPYPIYGWVKLQWVDVRPRVIGIETLGIGDLHK